MPSKEIKALLKENSRYNQMFARYDETRQFDLDKTRRSFTLRKATVHKLKKLSQKRRQPMSQIIEELIEKS
ncbi:MAG: hypothetical protein ABH950_07755 [Candidatus Altiarchaeota archaeon]